LFFAIVNEFGKDLIDYNTNFNRYLSNLINCSLYFYSQFSLLVLRIGPFGLSHYSFSFQPNQFEDFWGFCFKKLILNFKNTASKHLFHVFFYVEFRHQINEVRLLTIKGYFHYYSSFSFYHSSSSSNYATTLRLILLVSDYPKERIAEG